MKEVEKTKAAIKKKYRNQYSGKKDFISNIISKGRNNALMVNNDNIIISRD